MPSFRLSQSLLPHNTKRSEGDLSMDLVCPSQLIQGAAEKAALTSEVDDSITSDWFQEDYFRRQRWNERETGHNNTMDTMRKSKSARGRLGMSAALDPPASTPPKGGFARMAKPDFSRSMRSVIPGATNMPNNIVLVGPNAGDSSDGDEHQLPIRGQLPAAPSLTSLDAYNARYPAVVLKEEREDVAFMLKNPDDALYSTDYGLSRKERLWRAFYICVIILSVLGIILALAIGIDESRRNNRNRPIPFTPAPVPAVQPTPTRSPIPSPVTIDEYQEIVEGYFPTVDFHGRITMFAINYAAAHAIGLGPVGNDRLVQRYALAALWFAADGTGWGEDGYGMGNECQWANLTCDDNDMVTEIMLSGAEMTGPLPPEIGLLTKLSVLDVSDNELTGTVPSELGLLTSLDTLDLSINHFEGTVPAEIGQASDLRYLWLFDNPLTGTVPGSLCEGMEEALVDCEKVQCDCCPNELQESCNPP